MALPLISCPPRDPAWEPPHEDVPTRGRPLSGRVESAAAPHRRLLQDVGQLLADGLADLTSLIGQPASPERAARLVAGIVAVHVALAQAPRTARDAIRWFFGASVSARVPLLSRSTVRWSAQPDQHLVALLPYVLDPFGLTTRRGVLAGRACRLERESRKRLGTFYTPGDVARALAGEVVAADTRLVLDPACGAGVFLRAAFTRLCASVGPDRAAECLWGVDVDVAAADACALVLTHDWLARVPLSDDELPFERFRQLRARLVQGDALELFVRPAHSGSSGAPRTSPLPAVFDAVLTNPPFAPTGSRSSHVIEEYQSLRAARRPAGVNMMWPFWELASRAVGGRGRVGIVLPLSAAYLDGDVPRAGRAAAFVRGTWTLRFFDRTPDALFGDDVKQRVVLAVRRYGPPEVVRTTGLRRWSADRRTAALAPGEGVDMPAGRGAVLKIGTEVERCAVDLLRSLEQRLGDGATKARLAPAAELTRSPLVIAVAPTAYNWIGAFRDAAVATEARAHAAGKLAELTFASEDLADAAYGVVASSVFLWWWRMIGDLFHVPLTCLTRAPFPIASLGPKDLGALAAAGRACWAAALDNPSSAVNKGVPTVAYRPSDDSQALAGADEALGSAFGLAPEFVRFVRDDAERLRVAGRSV